LQKTSKLANETARWLPPELRLSHPMKILTIFIGTLVLNMFDASNCRADETTTEAMLRAESLGGLRLGLPEKDVLKLLGSPATRGELVFQGADGNYVQDWHYPDKGIELLMSAGEKKSGVKTIANITASAPCTFATRKGIKIGNAESAARKAYAKHVDRETRADPGILVVGSIYGGIIFNFTEGKVSRIFFGAAAE
jgi:hypothetical protein